MFIGDRNEGIPIKLSHTILASSLQHENGTWQAQTSYVLEYNIIIPVRSPDRHVCILVLMLSSETGILVIVVADVCSY